jgi:hypothetical protein
MRSRWALAAALTITAACSWDWDGFDPRLSESGAGAGTGAAGGAASGSGANASSSTTGGASTVDSYRDTVLSDGPVGYWRFGEPTSATTALDETSSHPGAYLGGVILGEPGALAGDANTAARFDGIDDQVDFGDAFDFPDVTPFSVEAWVAPDLTQPQTYGMICAKQLDALDGFELGIEASNQTLFFGREATGVASDPVVAPLAFGRFSHVVGTFDGISLRIYVNAVQMDLVASPFVLPDTSAAFIAGTSYETSELFAGVIDELAVYDKALTQERIQAHYMAGAR